VETENFNGKSVIVVGGGSSATDLAAELHEAGAKVQLIARQKEMNFHSAPKIGKKRSLWKRIRHPKSGLGPGMRSAAFCTFPTLFRLLPAALRVEIVRRHLGPSGTWLTKERVVGKVQIQLSAAIERAEVKNGRVHLSVRLAEGGTREYAADHLIAATGYHVDLDRLTFLSPELSRQIKDLNRTPILSSNFESSVPGLYFAGVSAANTFGPMMRFAFGASFTARHPPRRWCGRRRASGWRSQRRVRFRRKSNSRGRCASHCDAGGCGNDGQAVAPCDSALRARLWRADSDGFARHKFKR
jgi:hypothetical protein